MWASRCRGTWCSHPWVLWLCQRQHHTAAMFEPRAHSTAACEENTPTFLQLPPQTTPAAPPHPLQPLRAASGLRTTPPVRRRRAPSSPQQLPAPGPRRLRGEEPGPGGAARGRERRRDPERHRDGTGTGSGARGTRSRTPTPASAPRGAPVSAGAGPRGRRVLGLPPSPLPPPSAFVRAHALRAAGEG